MLYHFLPVFDHCNLTKQIKYGTETKNIYNLLIKIYFYLYIVAVVYPLLRLLYPRWLDNEVTSRLQHYRQFRRSRGVVPVSAATCSHNRERKLMYREVKLISRYGTLWSYLVRLCNDTGNEIILKGYPNIVPLWSTEFSWKTGVIAELREELH